MWGLTDEEILDDNTFGSLFGGGDSGGGGFSWDIDFGDSESSEDEDAGFSWGMDSFWGAPKKAKKKSPEKKRAPSPEPV